MRAYCHYYADDATAYDVNLAHDKLTTPLPSSQFAGRDISSGHTQNIFQRHYHTPTFQESHPKTKKEVEPTSSSARRAPTIPIGTR